MACNWFLCFLVNGLTGIIPDLVWDKESICFWLSNAFLSLRDFWINWSGLAWFEAVVQALNSYPPDHLYCGPYCLLDIFNLDVYCPICWVVKNPPEYIEASLTLLWCYWFGDHFWYLEALPISFYLLKLDFPYPWLEVWLHDANMIFSPWKYKLLIILVDYRYSQSTLVVIL